jgi:bacteriocin biosynthesis cyclodehydratase domain-containing protein
MLKRPRLKANVTRATVDGDKLFLISEQRHVLLEGRAAAAVAPFLNGEHTTAEIAGELADLPVGDVLGTVAKLEKLGQLVEGPGVGASDAWWDAAGVDPALASERLAAFSVSVSSADGAPADVVAESFERAGLHVGEGGFAVVVADDYLAPALEERNRVQVAAGEPWFLARVTGERVWLGPHFRPHQTACWACMAVRLEGNRQVERYLRRKDGAVRMSEARPAMLPSTVQLASALVATELQMIAATGVSGRIGGDLVTIDLATLESERHAVIRQPECPVCGDAPQPKSERVDLHSRPKHFTADGGHRVVSPDETYVRLRRHVSPLTGAVSSVLPQVIGDNGVTYSYSSGHNFALMQDSMFFLRKNLRGRSGGKGRTDIQAKVGAICEAIERYNGIWRGDEQRSRAAYSEISEKAVHPEELMFFSDRQYEGRAAWNAAQQTNYHVVPNRLAADQPIDWTTAWSLTHERAREVASAYCYFGHPDITDFFFCTADANGNAAGNTLEEAILQGLLELIERDSVGLWWYNRARRPAFDLDSIGEPYVDVLREHYDKLGRDLWVLDITSDNGIPSFVGVSARRSGPTQDIVIGFGAHVDPRMGALRALTEVNQFLPAVTDIRPDGTTNYWIEDVDAVQWWTTRTLESDPYVLPSDAPMTSASSFALLATDDISEDVRRCVARLAEHGHEVLVLDQTRPDIDLAVCKVMAPGLRHFWRRLGPGRLYDIPPQLGWIPKQLTEDELNPLSIFF